MHEIALCTTLLALLCLQDFPNRPELQARVAEILNIFYGSNFTCQKARIRSHTGIGRSRSGCSLPTTITEWDRGSERRGRCHSTIEPGRWTRAVSRTYLFRPPSTGTESSLSFRPTATVSYCSGGGHRVTGPRNSRSGKPLDSYRSHQRPL